MEAGGGATLLERETELSALSGAVSRLAHGAGSTVLIEGPAGIGKTSLLAAIVDIARREGADILRARGAPIERNFVFGVVRQLLEPRLGPMPAPPEDPSGAFDGDLRDDTDCQVLHDLFWRLMGIAEERPLLVCVDDAHWCDAASMRFLEFLTTRLEAIPVLLVLASRAAESDAAAQTLAAIASDAHTEVVAPTPLSPEAMAVLLAADLADPPDAEFVSACHSATGGNPFYARSLSRELRDTRTTPDASHAAAVARMAPSAVSKAVLVRLARLGADARALAQAIVILGDDVELPDGATLAGLDVGAARAAADALAAADVLADRPALVFTHPIVREAIHADMGRVTQHEQHLRAAILLQDRGASPEQVAAHFLMAGAGCGEPGVATLRAASVEALARGAPEHATVYLRHALSEVTTQAERKALLAELGVAELRAGDHTAITHLEQALRDADEHPGRFPLARALSQALRLAGHGSQAAELLSAEAIEAEARGELEQAILCEAELASLYPVYPAAFVPLFTRAQRAQHPRECHSRGEWLVLACEAISVGFAGTSAGWASELVERSLNDGRLLALEGCDSWLVGLALYTLIFAERFDAADMHLETALAVARRRGSPLSHAYASMLQGLVAYRRGDLDDAEDLARAACDKARDHDRFFLGFPTAIVVDVLVDRGDLDPATTLLASDGFDGALPDALASTWLLVARGRLRLARGDTQGAVDDLLGVKRLSDRWHAPMPGGPQWIADAVLALDALDQRDRARDLASDHLDRARRWGTPMSTGIAARALAQVETGTARDDLLREGEVLLQTSDGRLEFARVLFDAGAALRRDGALPAARDYLRRAADGAAGCGARALEDRARQELLAAGGRPRRTRTSGAAALTPSERRICELAAGGATNLRIAQELFLSVKTIEMHLGNSYRKLGISSRRDLAAALPDVARHTPVTPVAMT